MSFNYRLKIYSNTQLKKCLDFDKNLINLVLKSCKSVKQIKIYNC